jgi:hypothetical protein
MLLLRQTQTRLRRVNSPRALSVQSLDARRGTKGNENHKVKKRFQDAFQSAFKTHGSIERVHHRFAVIKNDFEGQRIPRMGDAVKLNMDVL